MKVLQGKVAAPFLEKLLPDLEKDGRDLWVATAENVASVPGPREKSIVVGHNLGKNKILSILKGTGCLHVAQGESPEGLLREVKIAATMMTDFDRFMSSPSEVILEGSGAIQTVLVMPFRTKEDKTDVLAVLLSKLEKVKGVERVRSSIHRIADEFLMNVLSLGNGVSGQLRIECNQERIFVGCSDSLGALDPSRVVLRLNDCLERGPFNTMKIGTGGAGFGLFSVFEASGGLYLAVEAGKKTWFCATLPLNRSALEGELAPKSFHVSTGNVAQDSTTQKGVREMSTLNVRKHEQGEQLVFVLEGAINEDSTFESLAIAEKKEIELDFDGVRSLNSCGIREWLKWLASLPTGVRLIFNRCPKVVVDQINMVHGFLPTGASVRSFYVPYFCQKCDVTRELLFTEGKEFVHGALVESEINKGAGHVECEECSGAMELDVMAAKYFRFLRAK